MNNDISALIRVLNNNLPEALKKPVEERIVMLHIERETYKKNLIEMRKQAKIVADNATVLLRSQRITKFLILLLGLAVGYYMR